VSRTDGVITSPNHPANYPKNLKKTEYVTVEKGKILRLEFTAFAVWVGGSIDTCSTDFVRITDSDGTTLMDNSCGYSGRDPSNGNYFQPPIITSKTNKVEIYFYTNDNRATTGWSLRWTAVAEGECYHRACVSELTRTKTKSGKNESTAASLQLAFLVCFRSVTQRNLNMPF